HGKAHRLSAPEELGIERAQAEEEDETESEDRFSTDECAPPPAQETPHLPPAEAETDETRGGDGCQADPRHAASLMEEAIFDEEARKEDRAGEAEHLGKSGAPVAQERKQN